ncbi:MAG: DNA-directed RNA polymerase subunit D [Candidatus Altiarchaeota archaeon]|nr:DNA-directed RNA polymerase subunit D [Candidatus Altiarchaeota archaeon]
MNVKITNKKNNRVEFNVSGITASLANAFRRAVISEVPIMAIEDVTFYQNSSMMDDEVLAHRLGLIPLKTDPGGIETMRVSLKSEGPGTVYSKELKPMEKRVKGKSSSLAAYDKIPIMKLTEGQRIELEATAQMRSGREHIKWQGGLASYEIEKDGSFSFFVESYGQMPVNELINKTFEVFNKKIKELRSQLK